MAVNSEGRLTLNKIRAFGSLLGLSVTFAVGFSCSSMAQNPIRIGASMSLTGKYALTGGYGREGYLLCEKHVNEKGGVLGRSIEFMIYDDRSDEKTAIGLYEKLITEDKVDAVIGPYSSPITDAVADVTEKHKRAMVAPMAAANSLWEKGRKYLVMLPSPLESASQGVLDLAARNGFKTVALINEDGVVAKSIAKGASQLVKDKGLQLVLHESYPKGTADFSALLRKVKASTPDLLVVASLLEDAIAINRQTRELDVNVKMFGSSPYGGLPDYYKALGKSAEFVYSDSFWEAPHPGQSRVCRSVCEGVQPCPGLAVSQCLRRLSGPRPGGRACWQRGLREAPRDISDA